MPKTPVVPLTEIRKVSSKAGQSDKTFSTFAEALMTRRHTLAGLAAIAGLGGCANSANTQTERLRVLVSTDIGGTDPDDFQSMVHLLVYGDVFDIEGLVSSPFGPGRASDIHTVIDYYARDFANLASWDDHYPQPETLRTLTKQGETELAPYRGYRNATEGSDWIIECARRDDSRPLHVLVWGGIEDLAQALHDAPDILPKLRVYWIGGPNKKWSPDAFQYIADTHKDLWIIESNAAYRGFFTGGDQSGDWGNDSFVSTYVNGRGALGAFFGGQLGGVLKMGDTPSVTRLLEGAPEDPSRPSWGGRYVRAWERPFARFDRITTERDEIAEFAIMELVLPVGGTPPSPDAPFANMNVENQSLTGHFDEGGNVRFRFCPKGAKVFSYEIESNIDALNGLAGAVTATPTPTDAASKPASDLPNWWTDNPAPEWSVQNHIGAKTVSQWREAFLSDFALRMRRCETKKG